MQDITNQAVLETMKLFPGKTREELLEAAQDFVTTGARLREAEVEANANPTIENLGIRRHGANDYPNLNYLILAALVAATSAS